jgi:hypothetical protein
MATAARCASPKSPGLLEEVGPFAWLAAERSPDGRNLNSVPDDHVPDRVEKRIRFGCGFLFGGLLGFFVAVRSIAENAGAVLAVALGIAVVCALLAVRYGDRFWYALREWLDW